MLGMGCILHPRLFAALSVASVVTLYAKSQASQRPDDSDAPGSGSGSSSDRLLRLFAVTFVATYLAAYLAEQVAGSGRGSKGHGQAGGGGGAPLKLDDVMKHVDVKLPTF